MKLCSIALLLTASGLATAFTATSLSGGNFVNYRRDVTSGSQFGRPLAMVASQEVETNNPSTRRKKTKQVRCRQSYLSDRSFCFYHNLIHVSECDIFHI